MFCIENYKVVIIMRFLLHRSIVSKYIYASEVANKIVWIKKFMTELGVVLRIVDLIAL
jgi:hypothetical protein